MALIVGRICKWLLLCGRWVLKKNSIFIDESKSFKLINQSFVPGTYYTPLDEKLERVDDRSKIYPSLKYYPWLAFLFAFQAFILYLPYFVWSSFNRVFSGFCSKNFRFNSIILGLEVRAFVSMANQEAFDDTGLSFDQRTKITRHIVNVLELVRANHESTFTVTRTFVT